MPRPPAPRPAGLRPRPLTEVAAWLGVPAAPGSGVEVGGITHDSHAVRPGDLYAALAGARAHGADFVAEAAAAGAAAVLTDPAGEQRAAVAGLPVLVVADPRATLGRLAAWLYGEPGSRLRSVGVTGTNGKTTCAYLVEAGLRAAGLRTGLIGTVETRVAGETVRSVRTTPESTDLQALLAVMVERGVDALAMEVSSHALALHRVDGLVVDVAVFTNLGRDHLDFHSDMEDYFQAKAMLFTPEHSRQGVVWVDDPWGRRLAGSAGVPVTTVGTSDADVLVVSEPAPGGGSAVTLTDSRSGQVARLEVALPGPFNAVNAALAAVALTELEVDLAAAAAGIATCRVPGRMETVDAGQPFLAVVDFAHTPDAVATALRALRETTSGRVLAVLGCGGDRDREKRPLMGACAAELADVLVITDDNPRSEDPAAIRAAVEGGARSVPAAQRGEVHVIAGRRDAIARAVAMAADSDVVAVLGKGHEQGQEIDGDVLPFDDRQVVRESLEAVGPWSH